MDNLDLWFDLSGLFTLADIGRIKQIIQWIRDRQIYKIKLFTNEGRELWFSVEQKNSAIWIGVSYRWGSQEIREELRLIHIAKKNELSDKYLKWHIGALLTGIFQQITTLEEDQK